MGPWPSPLYVICDVDVCERAGWQPVTFAAACFASGATVLQVRGKHLSSGQLVELADAVVALARPIGALVIVNDRPDVARMASAGGVHLGQDDVTPHAARAIVGPDARIGLSTHTDAQLASAVADPAVDYVAVGPVFGTTTKDTGYAAVGLAQVRRAVEEGSPRCLPVVAIGGITLERAPQLLEAGAAAVAVIADLVDGDPAARVRAYLARLRERRRV